MPIKCQKRNAKNEMNDTPEECEEKCAMTWKSDLDTAADAS